MIYALHILVGLVEAVTAITASAFCCRAVCCGKRHYPGTVIFAPNAGQFQGASGANVEFTAIPLSTVAPSVSSSNTYGKNSFTKECLINVLDGISVLGQISVLSRKLLKINDNGD